MVVADGEESEEEEGEVESPQNTTTETADPTEDSSVIFVTAKRSHKAPKTIPPKTEVALKSATRRVPVVWERPAAEVVYEGR